MTNLLISQKEPKNIGMRNGDTFSYTPSSILKCYMTCWIYFSDISLRGSFLRCEPKGMFADNTPYCDYFITFL